MIGTLIAGLFWGVLLPGWLWLVWRDDRAVRRDAASVARWETARKALRR